MTEHGGYCVSIRVALHSARLHAGRIRGDVMGAEQSRRNMVVCGTA